MGVTEAKRQRQGGEGDSELRVKDVFCFYYLHEHAGTKEDIHWIPNASQIEHDVLIGQVVKRIEEREKVILDAHPVPLPRARRARQ